MRVPGFWQRADSLATVDKNRTLLLGSGSQRMLSSACVFFIFLINIEVVSVM